MKMYTLTCIMWTFVLPIWANVIQPGLNITVTVDEGTRDNTTQAGFSFLESTTATVTVSPSPFVVESIGKVWNGLSVDLNEGNKNNTANSTVLYQDDPIPTQPSTPEGVGSTTGFKEQEGSKVIPMSNPLVQFNSTQTSVLLEEAAAPIANISTNTLNSTLSLRESEVILTDVFEMELVPTAVQVMQSNSSKADGTSKKKTAKKKTKKMAQFLKKRKNSSQEPKEKAKKRMISKKGKKTNNGKKPHKKSKNKAKMKKKKEKIPYFPYFKNDYCPPECACYGRVVQCSDKGVDKIPYGIPYNTRYMLLMNNKIDLVQLDLLNEYLTLEFLVLSNNRLTDSAIEGAFEGIEKLTRLYLDKNLLSSIPTDLPPTLEELRLNLNNISVISEQAWSRCRSLKVISINNNTLTNDSIPAGAFSSLTNLKTLSLNHNQLIGVPSKLPINLKELFLEGNQIDTISAQIFTDYSDLLYLDLSNNLLTNKGIDKHSFSRMVNLENLNLGKNLLNLIPINLPKALKNLVLEDNRIDSVSKDAFLKMPNLEQLGLSRNKIAKVAAGAFKGISALHLLDISHNRLLEVPRRLPLTMHSVALNDNKIKSISRDSFCGNKPQMSRLVLVHLEHNNIDMRNINTHAFRCLRGYQIIHFY
ncbi:asporin [Polyodon spathula]|uniref:asporin n=1 Tax=Polyodon spathula TaxID=7913 RepID=UPI001B7F46F6|nr:asporin [Polyodon spathula]